MTFGKKRFEPVESLRLDGLPAGELLHERIEPQDAAGGIQQQDNVLRRIDDRFVQLLLVA